MAQLLTLPQVLATVQLFMINAEGWHPQQCSS